VNYSGLKSTWQMQPSNIHFSYLTCSLLESWKHGFFTRQFYPAKPQELVSFLDIHADVYHIKQIHGNQVWTTSELSPKNPDSLSQGDGIVTSYPRQSVWVASADCTPVLIGDLKTGRVAAVHAGWRGTAKNILPITLERFLELGSRREDLLVALGPAIEGDVYQVAEEVAKEVGSSLFDDDVLKNLAQLLPCPIQTDLMLGKIKLDVRFVNFHQLRQWGLKLEQIAIAPYCTYKNEESFYSYRRTGQKQVQWSGIVSL
jgi:hypothetical protein